MFDFGSRRLEEYQKYIKKRLGDLNPILRRIAMGDFSVEIKIPEKEDGLTEFLVALDSMIENLRKFKKTQEEAEGAKVVAAAIAAAEKERRILAEKMARELKEEVKEKTRKVREVERLRERFMADASHELRTPLAVLQTNLDLLGQLSAASKEASLAPSGRESKSSPGQTKDVEDLIESSINRAKHLTAIIEELSLLSRGKRPEELREIIKLKTISEETVGELRPLADAKNINCQVKILAPDLEVMGDEAMLRKVIRNLVSNAIKYGRERGKVKITLRREAGEAGLEVTDNGIGISQKDLPHMFERFYRVKKRKSQEKGGIGLGLAICKWIVELHGGRIGVESKYGQGSKFQFFLPLKGTWEDKVGFWDYKLRKSSVG